MTETGTGSKDGQGAADHDEPFRFGKHPTQYLHVREFARLLIFRGRLREQARSLDEPEVAA